MIRKKRLADLTERFEAADKYIRDHWASIPYLENIKETKCPNKITKGAFVQRTLEARHQFFYGMNWVQEWQVASKQDRRWAEMTASIAVSELEDMGIRLGLYGRKSDNREPDISLDKISLKDLKKKFETVSQFLENNDNWDNIPNKIYGETRSQLKRDYKLIKQIVEERIESIEKTLRSSRKSRKIVDVYLGLHYLESLKKDIEQSKNNY